jgi:hypothetical protein
MLRFAIWATTMLAAGLVGYACDKLWVQPYAILITLPLAFGLGIAGGAVTQALRA